MKSSLSNRFQNLPSCILQEVTDFENVLFHIHHSYTTIFKQKGEGLTWNYGQFNTYKPLTEKIKELDSEGSLGELKPRKI